MTKRTLTLRRETLSELAGPDLSLVRGAADSAMSCGGTCPTYCVQCEVTDAVTTLFVTPTQSGCPVTPKCMVQ
jgi:hypothetical protein